MRELMITRINAIKDMYGFSKGSMRWQHIKSASGIHISELDFNTLDDIELVSIFEQVNRRFYTQM